jgi:hypothetical protein
MTLDFFRGALGGRFEARLDGGEALLLELIETRALPMPPFQGRAPFSLIFSGPARPILPQRIYALAHRGAAQALEIFLVPIAADAGGARYEAVFT